MKRGNTKGGWIKGSSSRKISRLCTAVDAFWQFFWQKNSNHVLKTACSLSILDNYIDSSFFFSKFMMTVHVSVCFKQPK